MSLLLDSDASQCFVMCLDGFSFVFPCSTSCFFEGEVDTLTKQIHLFMNVLIFPHYREDFIAKCRDIQFINA